jgi:hypothetical protein
MRNPFRLFALATALLCALTSTKAFAEGAESTTGTETRLAGFPTEVAVRAGLYGGGYSFSDTSGNSGGPFADLEASLQERVGLFAFDASLLGLAPFESSGTRAAWGGAARLGIDSRYLRALGGVALNASPGASLQVLPSLTVEAGSGDWRGILGVFDRSGLVPVRIGIGWRGFTLAYVPVLGAEASASYPLNATWSLQARAFIYTLGAGEAFDAVVGVGYSLPGGGS